MSKINKPKYRRGRRKCIFCGSDRKISKEHVFGLWLRELLPRDESTKHKSVSIEWPDENGPQPSVEKWSEGQGHIGSKQLRVLCQTCNNVSFCGLENRMKKALPPLITGQRANLLPGEQTLLATWAAKTTMVAEHFKPLEAGITQDERTWLLQNLTPPILRWFIWIAAYNGEKWRDLSIYQVRVRLSPTPVARPSDAPYYAQATTFSVGNILFCVVSSSSPFIDRFIGREAEGFVQIWAPQQRTLLWPPHRTLDDDDANTVANIIEHSGVFDHSLDPGANWTFAF